MEPTNVSINESMERYNLVRSFKVSKNDSRYFSIDIEKGNKSEEKTRSVTLLLKLGKIKKRGKKKWEEI